MLLRVERLRQAVIKMQSELMKNRLSLKAVRQSYKQSQGEEESSQKPMLALPSSSSPAISSDTRPFQGGRVSVTCELSPQIFTAEVTSILNREDTTM
jgi:hypothetical protein